MSDDGGKTVIEAPAIGVRKDVEKLRTRFDAMEKMNEQHTMAIMDFGKAHNGHVLATQRQVAYLAKTIDMQAEEIRLLKDQVDMLLKRLTEKGLV